MFLHRQTDVFFGLATVLDLTGEFLAILHQFLIGRLVVEHGIFRSHVGDVPLDTAPGFRYLRFRGGELVEA